MNYTINEIPNEATEAGNGDLGILWQDNKTKKISILNLFKDLVKKSEVTNTISATSESPITSKAVSSLLTISASSATITGAPPLQNGTTIRFFFTDQITGPDSSSALSISYNGTSYSVKATSNGSLKNFTAYPIATEQTRNLAKGEKTEEEKGETKAETKSETKSGTRATVTTYVYCQAYTTLEMMFDGTQFIIMGNPVVISNSDYTVYTDGSITYTDKGVENYGQGRKIVGTLSAPTYFNFLNDCGIGEYVNIEFWLTIWDTETYNNIVIHGFYLRDSFMCDDIVAKVRMDRTGENIYGTLIISGLNQTANKNKFVCYIKEV